nr:hypothetical protein [Tanacetum cinerariifolium]
MEPRPKPNREATLTLRPRSPMVHRQRERIVGFKDALNREGMMRGRNTKDIRPSEIEVENRGVNLPLTLGGSLVKEQKRTAMQQIGIVVFTIHKAIKFYTPHGIGTVLSQYNPREPKEKQRVTSEEHQEEVKGILSCVDTEERIVVNDQYPEQTITIGRQLPTKTKIRLQDLLRTYVDVFVWTTAHMKGDPRIVTIGGETFN